ncbi:hypothetical protein QFZ83_006409 [Variovorax sp. W1I1]|uniref:ThiF family adenylyltransferase n=1 Tax=Variovorax sp. W1I1 TaxID=3042309 RepID=UPI002784AF3B|nr:ThiF family adenylyltransferase [Variovorax sp. W1I1]MDQ0612238.1 hypothetical protein [Variovorax sp. W1I1]
MIGASSLTLTAELHEQARKHLFPGDGLEAAGILLCARTPGPRVRLVARTFVPVAHALCVRDPYFLRWPGAAIEEAIDTADADNLSLILLHSHPGGFFAFSEQDDRSDQTTMPGLLQAIGAPHGSAIMVPDGAMLARLYTTDLRPVLVERVTVPTERLRWWWSDGAFASRPMAFTSATREELGRLTTCVVGVSGTGSIVAEQLARLGFGRVQLIDFDEVESRNLNRILNSTLDDAQAQRPKVEVFERAISAFRGPGIAQPLNASIFNREAVLLASQADVVFSCMDSLEGRQIVDMLCAAFLLPLFDVGVSIPTRQGSHDSKIVDVCARLDYVRPGGPTLRDRGIYSDSSLRAEYLRRTSQEDFARELAAGYIQGVAEEAPSVITLNMNAASDLVMEFIARTYPFRSANIDASAQRRISVVEHEDELILESAFESAPNPLLARGDIEPLLGLPALAALPGQTVKFGDQRRGV